LKLYFTKEGFPDSAEAKALRAEAEQVTFLADGRRITEGHVNSLNMSEDEVRDIMAEAHGVGPENIYLSPSKSGTTGRSRSVGFRRWSSSWNPHAEMGDPNLN